jgi:SAM-dependent methyltransferase
MRSVVWSELEKYFSKFTLGRESLLELGPGYCDYINMAKFDTKIAIDVSPDLIKWANNSVSTIVGEIPLAHKFDKKFDLIVCSNFFEHLNDDDFERVLLFCFDSLKPTGRLVIMQPNFSYAYRRYFDDYTHRKIFTHVSMRSHLLNQGFVIEKEIPKFLPYSMGQIPRFIPIALLKLLVRIYLRSPIKPRGAQMFFVAGKLIN